MINDLLFPADIPRAPEERVRTLAHRVAADRRSRALLLYGPGGVGKTRLVRNLARAGETDAAVLWLEPIDVDDPEYWLLSNLERAVAQQLEPDGGPYFRPYLEQLSRLSQYARPEVGRDTVRSHLRRIDRSFADCYATYVRAQGRAVVLALDTVEVVRSSSFVLTLTQWMKQLPATLFVLSGRPWPDDGDQSDPLHDELDAPYAFPHRVETLVLGGFELDEAYRYLECSGLADALDDDEKQKIVHLTRGQPLWLALTVRYVATIGVPEEVARHPVEQICADLPFHAEPTPAGRLLHEEYRRRLVTRYRSSEFWPEAIKRLTVIRQNVTEPMFRDLMSDRELPSDTGSWEEAWARLLDTAWIRPRSNRRSVTLHDALAEELARRIIPLHDRDGTWRRELWHWARREYAQLVDEPTRKLERETAELDALVEAAAQTVAPEQERVLAEQRMKLDVRRNELDLLTIARLYYRVLTDHADGVHYFLELYQQANARRGLLIRELICLEMQQLLPDGRGTGQPYDLADGPVQDLRRWLESDGVVQYLDVGLAISEYLVENEQPEAAVELLERLPWQRGTADQRHTAHLRKGNALLRVRGRVRSAPAARLAKRPAEEAKRSFMFALAEADSLPESRRKAEVLKELGFYCRNVGKWDEADEWYERAREHIGHVTAGHGTDDELEELASICTNWAYVSALRGEYDRAKERVETAVGIRRVLGAAAALTLSLSVRGEVLRYERSFELAWKSYEEAVTTIASPHGVRWLGLLHQEQAICLFQAERAGVTLVRDQQAEAERLARSALGICRDHFVRYYPSALNRAGRIFAIRDPDRALGLLSDGAEEARRLADTWFHVSSLVEYVELGFQMWRHTADINYLTAIMRRIGETDEVLQGKEYGFLGLRGRNELVRAHIALVDGQEHDDTDMLNRALGHYGWGFLVIARAAGPRDDGPGTIAHEFATFRAFYSQLDRVTRERWRDELRSRWELDRWRPYTRGLLALLDDLA